jgi:hypothetical protein
MALCSAMGGKQYTHYRLSSRIHGEMGAKDGDRKKRYPETFSVGGIAVSFTGGSSCSFLASRTGIRWAFYWLMTKATEDWLRWNFRRLSILGVRYHGSRTKSGKLAQSSSALFRCSEKGTNYWLDFWILSSHPSPFFFSLVDSYFGPIEFARALEDYGTLPTFSLFMTRTPGQYFAQLVRLPSLCRHSGLIRD